MILSVLFLLVTSVVTSQSEENLKAINKVWAKFYQAFETLDHQPMAEIHSKDLVRISGGKNIRDYDSYINNYKMSYQYFKSNGISNNISLRFFERINNETVASERGVYRLEQIKDGESKFYYGQFHVLFKKEEGEWKILMDYDSSESDTIDGEDFEKAHAIDNFGPFVNKM